jgi:hypothetical protein
MSDEFDQQILENVTGPAKAPGDSGSVEQHKPSEMIEVDRYLQSKRATKRQLPGLAGDASGFGRVLTSSGTPLPH